MPNALQHRARMVKKLMRPTFHMSHGCPLPLTIVLTKSLSHSKGCRVPALADMLIPIIRETPLVDVFAGRLELGEFAAPLPENAI